MSAPHNISPHQFPELAARVRGGGGFTVSTQTGREPTSGISVAIKGHEEPSPQETFTGDVVSEYAERKQGVLSRQPQRHLGGWAEEGEGFLDVSKIHGDTPVGRVKARVAMINNDQIAGYDIGRDRGIRNPFHPRNQGADITAPTDRQTKRAWASMGARG